MSLFRSRAHAHSPEEQQKLWSKYRGEIGLKDAKFSSNAFEKLMDERAGNVSGLAKVEKAVGADDYKKLGKASEDKNDDVAKAAEAVHAAIEEALAVTDEINNAQKKFDGSVNAFKKLIEQVPEKHRASDIIGFMKELVDEGRKAIETQQKQEKEKLEAQFKDPEFLKNLKKALDIGDDGVEKVKKNMLADLDNKHKAQLEEFDKSTKESLNELHKSAAAEKGRLLFFAFLMEHGNQDVQNKIWELAAKKKQEEEEERKKLGLPPKPTSAVVGFSADHISLGNLDPKDIEFFKTVTGREIKKTEKGGYSIDFPTNVNFFYHLDPRDNLKSDMLHLISTIKALGYDKITVEIKYNDEEEAMNRGRQAFEACIESGFKPEDIRIEVNGVEKKAEDLFRKEPQKLQQLKEKSPSIIERFEKIGTAGTLNTAGVKAAVQEIREKAAAEELEQSEKEELEEEAKKDLSASPPGI